MNIKDAIILDRSKKQVLKIVAYIGNDKERFDELMSCVFSDDELTNFRCSWVMMHAVRNEPSLINPYVKPLIELLKKDVHNGVKRSILAVMEHAELSEEAMSELLEIGFNYLKSEKAEIALRAFSITVLMKIVRQYPALKNELKIILEEVVPVGSAAIVSRGKKALKQLDKL